MMAHLAVPGRVAHPSEGPYRNGKGVIAAPRIFQLQLELGPGVPHPFAAKGGSLRGRLFLLPEGV